MDLSKDDPLLNKAVNDSILNELREKAIFFSEKIFEIFNEHKLSGNEGLSALVYSLLGTALNMGLPVCAYKTIAEDSVKAYAAIKEADEAEKNKKDECCGNAENCCEKDS